VTLAFLAFAATAASARECMVTDQSGPPGTTQDGAAVAKGANVAAGAVVVTGPDTRIEITCDDGVVVTVGTATQLDLGNLPAPDDGGNIVLRLLRGISGFDVPRRTWDSFQVETDLAIASVRSTAWLVESKKNTAVFVRRGAVEVSAADAKVLLTEGQGVDVTVEGLGPTAVWGEPRIRRAGDALGFGWNEK
jgi:ferric-dicitrate binding protein FerR (iron transport regulator)